MNAPGRFDGKVVLISGGASGIGAASARAFVAAGAKVVIGDVQSDKGEALAQSLGEAALFADLDVTREDSWRSAVEAARARFGELTTVVNSAGISTPADIEAETLEGFGVRCRSISRARSSAARSASRR